jgi:hypothetical protein
LFGVTLLAFVGLLSVGLGWTETADAAADRDARHPRALISTAIRKPGVGS